MSYNYKIRTLGLVQLLYIAFLDFTNINLTESLYVLAQVGMILNGNSNFYVFKKNREERKCEQRNFVMRTLTY